MSGGSILERARVPIAVVVGAAAIWRMVHIAQGLIDDPDVWWVAAAGREMLATHAVPRTNLFSFVEPTHTWVMHEWLLGPPYALALQRFGPSAFSAIALGVLALEIALLLGATLGRARQASTGLLLALAGIVFFGGRFETARPASVSLVFPLAVALVAFAPRFRARALVAAVLVELVWANAHGSFPLGIVILLTAAADTKEDRPWRLGAAGAAAVITLVNPYGLALHGLVWEYLQGSDGIYGAIKASVGEFGSIAHANWFDGSSGPGGSIAVFAIFAALAVAAAIRPEHRVRAGLSVALWILAGLHVRYLQLAGLLTCVLLVPAADDAAEWLGKHSAPASLPRPASPTRGATKRSKRARAAVASDPPPAVDATPATESTTSWRWRAGGLVVASASLLGFVLFAFNHSDRAPTDWIDTSPSSPRGLASPAAIAHVPDGANLWVPFRSGGIAVWYGFPRGIRVFFDPRNDCYSAETLETSVMLELGRLTPEQVLGTFRKSSTTAILNEKRTALSGFLMLSKQKEWALSGQDGDWWLFRRTP